MNPRRPRPHPLILARDLLDLAVAHLDGRPVHLVGDAASIGQAFQHLPAQVTVTARLRADAAGTDPAAKTASLEQALVAYRADLVEGTDYDWALTEREDLRRQAVTAARQSPPPAGSPNSTSKPATLSTPST